MGAASVVAPAPATALPHDIPSDVVVRMFVKPEGDVLRVLLRVPLEAMRDYDFPLLGPGYLDIERAQPLLRSAAELWIAGYLEFYEDGRTLGEERLVATRVSLPSDDSFADWASALATVTGPPLPAGTRIMWQQALLDVAFELPITSETARFSVDPRVAHLGLTTLTVLRFVTPDGTERAFQYVGDPGLLRLDPRWHQAAWRFVVLGVQHILDGIDHLLFLMCLVVPLRRFRVLVPVVTSFTVAHSITLIASAFGLAPRGLWFPPLIEALIAASIVYMALENIVGARADRRWLIAFGFGLVHGFGFSFALAETLQFAGAHLLTSLLSFNVGVEIGQLLVLLVMVPALDLLFRRVVAERMGVILVSALLAHTGWHWMTDRWATFRAFELSWPAADALLLAAVLRWIMLAVIVGAAVWGLRGVFSRWLEAGSAAPGAGASSRLPLRGLPTPGSIVSSTRNPPGGVSDSAASSLESTR